MRYARSLFLSTASYITRRCLDVTNVTAILAIEIGKGLSIHYGLSPLLVGSFYLAFNIVTTIFQLLIGPQFKHGTPTT